MELLILSDTHGKRNRVREVLERTNPDAVLFLGDGLRDVENAGLSCPLYAVRGNCDWTTFADAPEERLEIFGGVRVFLTHGHRYGVKSGPGAALAAAARQNADVLLYGHVHDPHEEWLQKGTETAAGPLSKPLLVACPGSLGEPRRGAPSFATLTVRNGVPLIGFGTL